jgi:sugar phosphate isomerase/epimerase
MPNPDQLSVQLYTVRGALEEDFDGTLAKIAGFGYTQVEPFAFVNLFDDLKTGLSTHGLAAPTTHMGLLAVDDQDAVFTAAKELGIETIIVPSSDRASWQSAEGIAEIAAGLNAAAEKAAAHGLKVGYHNHEYELVSEIDGRHGLEVLAEQLDPAVVLEVDTYWAFVGGADVPALLDRLGDRVVALHIKDGDGSLDNKKQVPVGAGVVPVNEFMAAAPNALFVVELDDSEGDLVEAVGASREYLTGVAV